MFIHIHTEFHPCANNEIQGGHAGPPLRQHGIVGHRPTYGTMRSGANMIGFDHPQRGHNRLAHGIAVGVGGVLSFCVGVM